MTTRSARIHNAAFALTFVLVLAALGHQAVLNRAHYRDARRAAKRAYRHEYPHPLLIWHPTRHLPYVKALYRIKQSPRSKFWVIGKDLDLMMVMNYFAYEWGKQMRTSVETQLELERQHYAESYQPFEHKPPRVFEDVIRTHQDEEIF
ncbi:MAG: hypothetical protein Kow0059_11580 [Candidatus Sumerlaeia bacterium]